MSNAINDLHEYLNEGETVECIVFGAWGWGDAPNEGGSWEPGYDEPEPPPVPFELRGKTLKPQDAYPYMLNWCFRGGFGAPECYATYIWTNERTIWVTQYDGATRLNSAPRHPQCVIPDMPGG